MELKFDSRTDMLEVFPTRLFMFAIEGCAPLNDALKAAALTREASGEANAGGVIGGWRSGDDLFDWPDKGIDAIRQTALGAIQAVVPQIAGRDCTFNVRLSGSATVLRYGAYEKSHLTPRHHLTMVYAVEAGDTPNADAPESGTIEIDDPRSAAGLAGLPIDPAGSPMLVASKNGQLTVFPSWLTFRTNPYYGDGERVTLTLAAEILNMKRS